MHNSDLHNAAQDILADEINEINAGPWAVAVASWRRTVAGATSENKWAVFKLVAREIGFCISKGLGRADAADLLNDIAGANDLIEAHGQDGVQQMISAAFAEAEAKAERVPGEWPNEAPRKTNSGKQPTKPRFKLVRFSDLQFSTAPTALVKGLIPRTGLVVIWGPPKCGKSFSVFDLFLHVAFGWEYRGHRVITGPVVYCAFEGAEGFKARATAFRKHHNIAADDPVPFYLLPVRLDLVRDHVALIASIREQLSEEGPVTVVLDTLNRSIAGSESSDDDMTKYLNAADAVHEAFGCVVAIVHHCGVNDTRPRGHTSLTGTVVGQLAVKRDAADNVVMTVEYMKDGPEGETVTSRLQVVEVGTNDDGDLETSCVVVPVDGEITGQRQTVTGAAKIALDLLQRAIIDGGEVPPASNNIPPDTRTIAVDAWRRYCYLGTVTESDNPDTKQKAFVRVVKRLQELGAIGVWNDQVWIAGHAGHRPDIPRTVRPTPDRTDTDTLLGVSGMSGVRPGGRPSGSENKADKPGFVVKGRAPGQRCLLCETGRDVMLIDRGDGHAAPLHIRCVEAAGQPKTASVPFMITVKMKAELRERGYTAAQIREMTPQQVHEALAQRSDDPE